MFKYADLAIKLNYYYYYLFIFSRLKLQYCTDVDLQINRIALIGTDSSMSWYRKGVFDFYC